MAMHDTLGRALHESEERYRSVVTAMAEGVILQDTSSSILAANEAAERLLGLTVDQMMGRTSLDPRWRAIHEDGSPFPGETHPVPVTLQTGQAQRDVVMGVYKPDGSLTWLSINSQPLVRPGEPLPYAVVCTFADITQHKLAEDALRHSEDRYRRIVDATVEGVWMIELDGATAFANRRMAELLRCTPEELATANMWEFIDVGDHAVVTERLAARARGIGEQHDFRLKRKDGTFVWTSMSTSAITFSDGRTGALAMVRDLTGTRRMEAELRESQERLNLALSAGQMATWEWDVSGGGVAASVQLRDILGLPAEASIITRDQYFSFVHPDDRQELAARMKAYADSGSSERFFNEYRIVRPDGRIRWVQSSGRAYVDQTAGERRILGAVSDVTDRRALEHQLDQARKLESIGRLAGGVAHDFNNVLTAIFASVSLAERLAPDTLQEELATIRDAAERATDLTRQLLAFARRQVIELRPLGLNDIVGRIEKMLSRVVGEHIALACRLAPALWTVRGDATQLEQVLVNLVVNARDAMPNGGPITIETRNTVVDPGLASTPPDVVPGDYVVLSVTDAGTGIDDVTLRNIFEPFFTTKRSGTGLGLASSYGIVKQLGGHIAVTTTLGQGSRFDVYLPRANPEDRAAVAPTVAAIASRPHTGRTLLVVEDDELLRRVTVRHLTDVGYEVLIASDGEQALAIARQHAGPIDLVITDVIMPRLSGGMLADQLQALRGGIGVLLVSGYSDQMIERQGVLGSGRHFLAKPYTMEALVERITELIGNAGS